MNLNWYGQTVAIIPDTAFSTGAELDALTESYWAAGRIVGRRFKSVERRLPQRSDFRPKSMFFRETAA